MLFLDGVYTDDMGRAQFRWVKAPTNSELNQLTHTIAQRLARHPERGADIAVLCNQAGIESWLASTVTSLADDVQVLIVDTLGELVHYYRCAPSLRSPWRAAQVWHWSRTTGGRCGIACNSSTASFARRWAKTVYRFRENVAGSSLVPPDKFMTPVKNTGILSGKPYT